MLLPNLLRADLRSFNEDSNLLCGQKIENYLRNFNRLQNFQADRLSNFGTISKTIKDSVEKIESAFKSKFKTLQTKLITFLDSIVYVERNKSISLPFTHLKIFY